MAQPLISVQLEQLCPPPQGLSENRGQSLIASNSSQAVFPGRAGQQYNRFSAGNKVGLPQTNVVALESDRSVLRALHCWSFPCPTMSTSSIWNRLSNYSTPRRVFLRHSWGIFGTHQGWTVVLCISGSGRHCTVEGHQCPRMSVRWCSVIRISNVSPACIAFRACALSIVSPYLPTLAMRCQCRQEEYLHNSLGFESDASTFPSVSEKKCLCSL